MSHFQKMLNLCCFMLLQAMNEFDLRATDWRKKLESQRGAVLAFETKNNKNKMARWTAAALLGGADMIKLGYVSRAGPKDNINHVILGTQVRAVTTDIGAAGCVPGVCAACMCQGCLLVHWCWSAAVVAFLWVNAVALLLFCAHLLCCRLCIPHIWDRHPT